MAQFLYENVELESFDLCCLDLRVSFHLFIPEVAYGSGEWSFHTLNLDIFKDVFSRVSPQKKTSFKPLAYP